MPDIVETANPAVSGLDPELEPLYADRFSGDEQYRLDLWQVLCKEYFQQFVRPTDTVLEIAAGHCEFINAIAASEKIALDLNPAVARQAAAGVRTVIGSATDMSAIPDASVDVAFVSNFFEHLERADILAVLREARRVLRPTGRLLVLQPNIRFCAKDYWMFFDHITAIDDRSLVEALTLAGFRTETLIPRFLPYTTKSRLPKGFALVRAYLKVPALWRIFGAQAFAVAVPAA